jgi:hypothetical protein
MTDAEEIAYFTDVLKRLDALRAWAPKRGVLFKLVAEASEAVGGLAGYSIANSRK